MAAFQNFTRRGGFASKSRGEVLVGVSAMAFAMACGGASPYAADDSARPGTTLNVSPQLVELEPGDRVQFTANLTRITGEVLDRPSGAFKWSATGGTINQDGLFVAGSKAGQFEVVAKKVQITGKATIKIVTSSSSDPDPTSSPPEGIKIPVGASIQAAVDANPAGTQFVIAAGRHLRQAVVPKDGNVFYGETGAILDGGGVVERAFTGSASNVTVRDLVIERYAPPPSDGVIDAKNATGWRVEGTEIRYNVASVQHAGCETSSGCGGMGIKAGDKMVVRNNYLHHNDQYGIGGSGVGIMVEGNEIAFNNYRDAVRNGFGAGATKFVNTSGLVFRGNYSHDNRGSGFWTDIDNVNVLVEGNRIENNKGPGIFHEISHSAVIRNNTVRGNGFEANWLYAAGITIAHSDNVEVYGNTVEGNAGGIAGIQQNRDGHYLVNLWVHDNKVSLAQGGNGVAVGDDATFDPFTNQANNRFDRNEYKVAAAADPAFRWSGKADWRQWQASGQDPSGSYVRQ